MELYVDKSDGNNCWWFESNINDVSHIDIEGDYVLVKSRELLKSFVVGHEEVEYETVISGFWWNLLFKPKTETKTRNQNIYDTLQGYDVSIYQGGEEILKGFELSK